MTQHGASAVNCPHCGTSFGVPAASGGSRVACPKCGKQVKIAGAMVPVADDDEWLRLDEDIFGEPAASSPVKDLSAAAAEDTEPVAIAKSPVQPSGFDGFDNFDLPEFQIPAVIPSSSSDSMPGARDDPPPLSDADLEALQGFAGDDNEPAPVKVTFQAPVSDSYRVKCPICESLTYAKVSQIGKKIRCSDCHSTITVPPPPKPKKIYKPDIEAAKPFAFQDNDDPIAHQRPADPFRKSAADLLRNAESEVADKPDDNWDVPDMGAWFQSMFGIFRDPAVIGYWVFLSVIASVPTAVAVNYESLVVVIVLFAGGIMFAGVVMAHGFAILQAVANGEKRVSEWPMLDIFAWLGPLFIALAAAGVAAGPVWFGCQFFFGSTLLTVALTMFSLYLFYPFVLLSMLDEQSVFVPFSVEVSKSVTSSSEKWGGFYLTTAILFFVQFLIFLAAAVMPPMVGAVLAITSGVATTFIYFNVIGRLAYAIGQSVNERPMVNDIQRKPKLPD